MLYSSVSFVLKYEETFSECFDSVAEKKVFSPPCGRYRNYHRQFLHLNAFRLPHFGLDSVFLNLTIFAENRVRGGLNAHPGSGGLRGG